MGDKYELLSMLSDLGIFANVSNSYSALEIKTSVQGELISVPSSCAEIDFLLIDSRKIINGQTACFFALVGPNRDGHLFMGEAYEKGVRCFVVSKPINKTLFPEAVIIHVQDTLIALQTLCKQHRDRFSFPVIGITGSNGKTIVKEWIHQLLKDDKKIVRSPKSYNSQVGVPLSLWQCQTNDELGVFEAGISKPNEMAVLENLISPDIGLITNIGDAHDENFTSRKQKVNEKLKLFKHCKTVVFCKDYLELQKESSLFPAHCNLFSWSFNSRADLIIETPVTEKRKTKLTAVYKGKKHTVEIPFVDKASVENAIHCWALLLALGYSNKFIKDGLLNLSPVAMRLELKEGAGNCWLINDYYNADLASLKIALHFLEHQNQQEKKTVVLSDILENGKESEGLYQEIAQLLSEKKVNRLIGIGQEIYKYERFFEMEKAFFKTTEELLEKIVTGYFSREIILLKGARVFGFEKISLHMQRKTHNTVLEVNLTAVQNNLSFFKSQLNPLTKIMVMVKAFSYGSGTFEVANLLQFNKVNYLGVAYVDEGVELRKSGIKIPIMVMNPDPSTYPLMIEHQLEPEIFNFKTFSLFGKTLEDLGRQSPYPVHLKIDTGMHRLGFSIKEVPLLIEHVKKQKNIKVQSVFSHLATADEPTMTAHTETQINLFLTVKSSFEKHFKNKPIFHILNTAGILSYPKAQMGMVRLGLGLYGVSAVPGVENNLEPVNTLKTSISQIKTIHTGDAVGYGRREIATRSMSVATIPIGYADGLRRSLGNRKGYVLVNDKKAFIIGNVCMDMCMIDVTNINTNEGDEVIVFGKKLPASTFAKMMDTIPYEALTAISPRVKRIYFQE